MYIHIYFSCYVFIEIEDTVLYSQNIGWENELK